MRGSVRKSTTPACRRRELSKTRSSAASNQAGFEEQFLNRMNRFDVAQSRIETSVSETYETLAHFVLYWLTHTEPIQDGEREAAQALGQRRFEHFVGQVARRIAQGLG